MGKHHGALATTLGRAARGAKRRSGLWADDPRVQRKEQATLGDDLLGSDPDARPPAATLQFSTPATMEITKWSEAEQQELEAALKKFPQDKFSPLGRYIKMSALFPKKSVRDVALRVKWLSKREEKKKKKGHDSSKKRQDKGAKADSVAWQRQQQPSALGEKANQLYGPITEVLDQNIVVIKQIQQNMMHNKVRENTELLLKFRDNILKASNTMNNINGIMKQMPPLPAQVNTQLANSFLPSKS